MNAMPEFLPLQRIWVRTEQDKEESDHAYANSLLYLGEMQAKLITAGMVSAIKDDKDRHRYGHIYELLRADGIGDWANALDRILTGPSAQFLNEQSRQEQRDLTQKCGPDTWQYEAARYLHECCTYVRADTEPMPARISAARNLHLFAQLRNKTRGHGAPGHDVLRRLCVPLRNALNLINENYSLFMREWAYLHRNLSGKYRVTRLTDPAYSFDYLKKNNNEALSDGIYIFFDIPRHVELAASDADFTDFFLANGNFTPKRHEYLSYATGGTIYRDSSRYLTPPGALPKSETEGRGSLEALGHCLTNLPTPPADFIRRDELEAELRSLLLDDRHQIVTLVGRGGIGKTSLALKALHDLSSTDRYELIIWFSARDIELTPSGPKQVRPRMIEIGDVSRQYLSLVCSDPGPANAQDFFIRELYGSDFRPILFAFDNFETVISPVELYNWIDTHIRPPNKAIITTRYRDFRGDYPIEVRGMTEQQCNQLIDSTIKKLGIRDLVSGQYRQKLFEEADGHPYVIKVLLGEVANSGKAGSVQRIMARKEDILTALFERTYNILSPAAQRVFLTLSNWNSAVPLVALQAVMLRLRHDFIDVDEAVRALERSSFVEAVISQADAQEFLHVPLAAALFGRGKLVASPCRAAVEADTKLLQQFGASQRTSIMKGIKLHISRFMSYVAKQIETDPKNTDEYVGMLEVLARRHNPTWLAIAELYDEIGQNDSLERAKGAVRQYLEQSGDISSPRPWKMLAEYCRRSDDLMGEVHALVELCKRTDVEFHVVSASANRFNSLLASSRDLFERDEKRILADEIAKVMEDRIDEATATDRSRLAWLCLHLGQEARARDHIREGLAMDPDNQYCLRLYERLV
jgi:NB-ARC domain